MKKFIFYLSVTALFLSLGIMGQANAVPITPKFNDYPDYTPPQDDLDATASAWFDVNYGITFDHMYMYTDTRDTWDGLGISNGWISENYVENITGTVYFSDTTNFLTLDWFNIEPHEFTLSIFDSSDNLLDTHVTPTSGSHTLTFNAANISRFTITGTGGFIGISSLAYDYDGTTDGINRDTTNVPEPSAFALMGLGLMGLGFARRRRTQ